jgi:hypothetical protein
MKKYANAADVLPHDLLKQVRQHYHGMLYVPAKNARSNNRQIVLSLFKQKVPVAEIALLTGLTIRRINQILQEHR